MTTAVIMLYLKVFQLDNMRVTQSLEDFNFSEQIFSGSLIKCLFLDHLYCHNFPAVPLQDRKCFHSVIWQTMYSVTLTSTHLSVGFVYCGIGTPTEFLCEDEVRKFWWCKTGGSSHVAHSSIRFPGWHWAVTMKWGECSLNITLICCEFA